MDAPEDAGLAPTVEILIPYWGDPQRLYEAVRSVLSQTDPDWRLLVVDDAYPDPSVATWFAELGDPRVRYERNEVNLGITGNFRRCLELSTQSWVVFMGCDDVMLAGYVEIVKRVVVAFPEATIVQPGVVVIDDAGAPVTTLADNVKRMLRPDVAEATALQGEELATRLMHGEWLYWPSLAFRRDAVARTPMRDGFRVIQDVALIMDLVFADAVLVVEPALAFAYRRHSHSAAQAAAIDGSRFEGERRYYALARRQALERGWPRAARAAGWHVTSRLHAVAQLPAAARARSAGGARTLLAHAFAAFGDATATCSAPPREQSDAGSTTSPVVAVMTAFRPDERVGAAVAAALREADRVVVVDNTPVGEAGFDVQAGADDRVTVLRNDSNLGLAVALNRGIASAPEAGAYLLLDQDSAIPSGLVERLAARLDHDPTIGVAGPAPWDFDEQRYLDPRTSGRPELADLPAIITSGMLVRREVVERVGPFREDFFVDNVDQEFCLRVRENGWRVVQDRTVLLAHSLGSTRWHGVGPLRIRATHHPTWRLYWVGRNTAVMIREHWRREPVWALTWSAILLYWAATIVLVEPPRGRRLLEMLHGLDDGRHGRTDSTRIPT